MTTNVNYLESKWEQLKGLIKENWGKLTNDDLTRIEGKKQRLISILEEKYEYSEDEAQKKVEEFMTKHQEQNQNVEV